MKKTEGTKLSRIGKILSTVLAKDESVHFLDANERGYVCNAKLSVREMLEAEFQKHEIAAEEWKDLAHSIDSVLSPADIKEGFDPTVERGDPKESGDDIPGQGLLDEGGEVIESKKAPSVIRYEEQIDKMLLEKIGAGTSKSDSIQQTAAELVCVKGDVEVRFLVLTTEGKIVKDGRKYALPAPASAEQVQPVLPESTPESTGWTPPSIRPEVPAHIKAEIISSVVGGNGKAGSIAAASKATGETKQSVSAYWDQLEREGVLSKTEAGWQVAEHVPELGSELAAA